MCVFIAGTRKHLFASVHKVVYLDSTSGPHTFEQCSAGHAWKEAKLLLLPCKQAEPLPLLLPQCPQSCKRAERLPVAHFLPEGVEEKKAENSFAADNLAAPACKGQGEGRPLLLAKHGTLESRQQQLCKLCRAAAEVVI